MSAETMPLQEHISILIQQIAKEHNFELDETTITVTLLNRGEDAPQFKFKIKIVQEGKEDLDLFAKVTELCNNNWESYLLKPFEKERLFYTRLMKIYRELEDKHSLTENEKLRLPQCFRAEAAHKREILILEDLTKKGYHLANRFESVCWSYASAAITELAKFHALSMAFKNETPAEFQAFTNQLPGGVFEKNEAYVNFLEEFKSLALSTVRNEHKKKLKIFFKSLNLTSFNNILKPSKCKVIVHGHFWPKNCIHKVLSDGTVELVTLDFQYIQPGSPVTDLFHFIFTASDAAFRSKHYGELVEHYCSELIRTTARLGVNIEQEFPSEAMESEMIEKLPCGLYSAVAYLPVLAIDDRQTSGMVDEDDAAGFAIAELYSRRLNQVVDAYVAAGVLEEGPQMSSRRCGMCFLC